MKVLKVMKLIKVWQECLKDIVFNVTLWAKDAQYEETLRISWLIALLGSSQWSHLRNVDVKVSIDFHSVVAPFLAEAWYFLFSLCHNVCICGHNVTMCIYMEYMAIVPFSLKNCNQKYLTLPSLRCREQQVCPKQEKIYIQDCSKSDLKIQRL